IELRIVGRVDVELARGTVNRVRAAGHPDRSADVFQSIMRLVADRRIGGLFLLKGVESAPKNHGRFGEHLMKEGVVVMPFVGISEEIIDADWGMLCVEADGDVAE